MVAYTIFDYYKIVTMFRLCHAFHHMSVILFSMLLIHDTRILMLETQNKRKHT